MTTQEAWLTTEDREYIAAHPEIADLFAKAEPQYHHALVTAARDAFEGARAEAREEVLQLMKKPVDELRALAGEGSAAATALLEERTLAAMARRMGVSTASIIKHGMQAEPTVEAEISRMSKGLGITRADIAKHGGEQKAGAR